MQSGDGVPGRGLPGTRYNDDPMMLTERTVPTMGGGGVDAAWYAADKEALALKGQPKEIQEDLKQMNREAIDMERRGEDPYEESALFRAMHDDGNVHHIYGGVEHRGLRELDLVMAPRMAPDGGAQAPPLRPGDYAMLQYLHDVPRLNGAQCSLLEFDQAQGVWHVLVGQGRFSVRPENVAPVPPGHVIRAEPGDVVRLQGLHENARFNGAVATLVRYEVDGRDHHRHHDGPPPPHRGPGDELPSGVWDVLVNGERVQVRPENIVPNQGQYRPTVSYQTGKGVVHRVHHEDGTVTVQFLDDQHRTRVPFSAVKNIDDITPEFPDVILKPGQKMPTRLEIKQMEREQSGLPALGQLALVPGAYALIQGLRDKQKYNGRHCKLLEFDPGVGLWEVLVGEEHFALSQENMAPIPPGMVVMAQPGDVVRLQGLVNRPFYNGQLATLVHYQKGPWSSGVAAGGEVESGVWDVVVGQDRFCVRPENISLLHGPQKKSHLEYELLDNSKVHERRIEKVQQWGIPEPTLDALRNRSIPMYQVTGNYGRHFYTGLYENNFYAGTDYRLANRNNLDDSFMYDTEDVTIVGHRYIPLEGPELDLMPDGKWRAVRGSHGLL